MSRAAPVTAAGSGAVAVLLGQVAERAPADVQTVWWVLACGAAGVSFYAAGMWAGASFNNSGGKDDDSTGPELGGPGAGGDR